ncbi:MAG: hypothetical protein ACRCUF_21895 [Aeromonas sobria]
MELEVISNDQDKFLYVEGHVHLGDFLEAVHEYGHLDPRETRHTFLVEKPVPDHHRDEFGSWFVFCDADEPGAFPVTCATV